MNSLKNKNDDFLVEMSLLGDEKAYEELVIRHEKSVKGTALKVTENEFSAEDASQDAFVSAWIKLDSLREREKFGSWVCSIAKNCARNLVFHYQNTVPDISLNLIENTAIAGCTESELEKIFNLQNISQQERDEKLHEAVDTLSEKIRETVTLHYFKGLSVAEIAEKQNLPVGTVKWRLNEGRKQLRKEYGIMKENKDDITFVEKVMQQVEQLKLWSLKSDKTGFEANYRKVLENVEKLEESKEKHHALADVWLRGYWWLPGKKNDEIFSQIKQSAEISHNEDVMEAVVLDEMERYSSNKEKTEFLFNTQLPYLEKHKFVKALGSTWFWAGNLLCRQNDYDKGIKAFEKTLEILDESDVYYANALSAIHIERKRQKATNTDFSKLGTNCTGEVLKFIDGKLYFWSQPGYSKGFWLNSSIVWNCSRCDNLIMDEGLQVGESIVSTDKKATLTFKDKNVTVDTVSGKYENCTCFIVEGSTFWDYRYCETYFCPNIGIVKQITSGFGGTHEWQLSNYTVKGGNGMLPFAKGNSWNYAYIPQSGKSYNTDCYFEVISCKDDTVVLTHHSYNEMTGYDKSTWEGNILHAREEYVIKEDNSEKLVDVTDSLLHAKELAVTKKQKVHTDVALNVMSRIMNGDPEINPDYTQKGRWDFFSANPIIKRNGEIIIGHNSNYSFEWKETGGLDEEGFKVLYSFLYEAMQDEIGKMWSHEWKVGYHIKTKEDRYGGRETIETAFSVLEDETVETEAGIFQNCRHIYFEVKGNPGGRGYFNGKKNFWFAPDVGIVKFSSSYWEDTREAVWELTEYRGTAEGYFPVADGLFRRYEPTVLGNGWHASVEYTFVEDEDGTVLFRNALGTQDRSNYEAGKYK